MVIFENAKVLTMDTDTILDGMQVETEDELITYIGVSRHSVGRHIDCEGKVLMPAFVDANARGVDEKQYLRSGVTTACCEKNSELIRIISSDKVKKIDNILEMSEDTICDEIKKSHMHNIVLQFDLCKTLEEVGECDKIRKMSPVQYCERLGLLDTRVLIGHATYTEKDDLDILSYYNAGIVYCPSYDAELGRGIAPIVSMLKRKIMVCFGTATKRRNMSVFREMYLTSVMQKVQNSDINAIAPFDILKMVTINGAVSLGINNLGYIKTGYKADILLVKVVNESDIITGLIQDTSNNDIKLTMCNGKILFEEL